MSLNVNDPASLPINSGLVSPEALTTLPVHNKSTALGETRLALLEAGLRLFNAAAIGEDDLDAVPFVQQDDTIAVATDIKREILVNDGILVGNARIKPLTPGAFYRVFTGESNPKLLFHKCVIAYAMSKMVEEAASSVDSGVKDTYPYSTESFVIGELAHRAARPVYMLLGSLALSARQEGTKELVEMVHQAEIARIGNTLKHMLSLSGRALKPEFSIAELATVAHDLLSGLSQRLRTTSMNQEETDAQVQPIVRAIDTLINSYLA